MPAAGSAGRRVSYETRLLIVTIVVSALVLLLLARLRFPEAPPVVTATQPLDRLAARATYDDLATSIARLEEAIAPNLVTLRASGATDPAPRQLTDVLLRAPGDLPEVQHFPALRIGPGTGVAALPPGTAVSGVVGRADPLGVSGVIGADPVRRLALVRLPEAPARPVRQLALADLRTPIYVVAVEGTRAGVTLRPVFLGRAERFTSPRFSRPLLPLGGALVTGGALMFTLQGEFLGCVIDEDGTLAIVGATDVLDTVERLLVSPPMPVDPGISVQPLTAGLAAATGVPHGVVVAAVFEDGPADGACSNRETSSRCWTACRSRRPMPCCCSWEPGSPPARCRSPSPATASCTRPRCQPRAASRSRSSGGQPPGAPAERLAARAFRASAAARPGRSPAFALATRSCASGTSPSRVRPRSARRSPTRAMAST
jgi:hypothetical protein